MTSDPALSAAPYLERLDVVRGRLERLATTQAPPEALTDPDPDDEEQWDWGQVWAHVAEFPGYWLDQLEHVLAAPRGEPPPFGRTKADPGRVGAIEADRLLPTRELWARTEPEISRVRDAIEGFSAEDWDLEVSHSRLGIMGMPRILERFLVGHLEEHAAQLDGLASG